MRMAFRVGLPTLVLVMGLAGTALGQPEKPGARERALADRYEKVLVRNPIRGTAFQRLYELWANGEGIPAWVKRLEARALKAPSQAAWLLLLGYVAEQEDDVETALAHYRGASERDPKDWRASLARARLLQSLKRYEDALVAYTTTKALGPPPDLLMDIQRRLARLHLKVGERDEALKVWHELVDAFPEDVALRNELAELLASQGDEEAAIAMYEKLKAMSPDAYTKVQASWAIADLHLKGRRSAEAGRVFKGLLDGLAPESWLRKETHRRLEKAYRHRWDLAGLTKFYEAWLTEHPQDLDVEVTLAGLYAVTGKSRLALDRYGQVLQRSPTHVAAREALARLHMRVGRAADAAAEYEKLAAADPSNVEALVKMGDAWMWAWSRPPMERRQLAEAAWRRIATSSPKDPRRWVKAAEVFRWHLMVQIAIEHYQKAIDLAPDVPDYHEFLAEYLHRLDRKSRAMLVIDGLVKDGRGVGENRLRHARILRTWGQDAKCHESIDDGLKTVGAPYDFELLVLKIELLLDKKQHDASGALLHQLDTVAKTVPQQRRAMQLRLEKARVAGQVAEHLAEIRAAQEKGDRQSALDFEYRARLEKAGGQAAVALRTVQDALDLHSESVPLIQYEAELYRHLGYRKEVVSALRRLIALQPHKESVLVEEIAELQRAAQEYEAAVQTARRLIELSPDSRRGYIVTSTLQWKGRDFDGAIRTLKDGLRQAPRDLTLRRELAMRLLAMAETKEALAQVRQAMDLTERPDEKIELAHELVKSYAGNPRRQEELRRVVADILSLDLVGGVGEGDRDGVASGLYDIAGRLRENHQDLALEILIRHRQIAVERDASLASTMEIFDLRLEAGDATKIIVECGRLLPWEFQARAATRDDLLDSYHRLGAWLFRTEGGPWTSRGARLVTLFATKGRLVDLQDVFGTGASDPDWERVIGLGMRALAGISRGGRDLSASRSLQKAFDFDARLLDASGAEWLVALTVNVAGALAERGGAARNLAAKLVDRHVDWVLKRKGMFDEKVDLLTLVAHVAARRGDRKRAHELYGALANLTPTSGRARTSQLLQAGAYGARRALDAYEKKERAFQYMREDGFWGGALDTMFRLVDQASGAAIDIPAPWSDIIAEWRQHARGDARLDLLIESGRAQLKEPHPDVATIRRLLFYARARGRSDLVAEIAGGAPNWQNPDVVHVMGIARMLVHAGYPRSARQLLANSIPTHTPRSTRSRTAPTLHPGSYWYYQLPHSLTPWFAGPEWIEILSANLAQWKKDEALGQRPQNIASITYQALRASGSWTDSDRRRLCSAAHPIFAQVDRSTTRSQTRVVRGATGLAVSNRTWLPVLVQTLEGAGREHEAYETLSAALLSTDPGALALTFLPGSAHLPGHGARIPADVLIDLATRVGKLESLRSRLATLSLNTKIKGDVARRLRILLLLREGNIEEARTLITPVITTQSRSSIIDPSFGVLADAAARTAGGYKPALDLVSALTRSMPSMGFQSFLAGSESWIRLAHWHTAQSDRAKATSALDQLATQKRWDIIARYLVEHGTAADAIDAWRRWFTPGEGPVAVPGRATLIVSGRTRIMTGLNIGAMAQGPVDAAPDVAIAGILARQRDAGKLDGVIATLRPIVADLADESPATRDSEPMVTLASCHVVRGEVELASKLLDGLEPTDWPANLALLLDVADHAPDPSAAMKLVWTSFTRWPYLFRGHGARLVRAMHRHGLSLPLDDERLLRTLSRLPVSRRGPSAWAPTLAAPFTPLAGTTPRTRRWASPEQGRAATSAVKEIADELREVGALADAKVAGAILVRQLGAAEHAVHWLHAEGTGEGARAAAMAIIGLGTPAIPLLPLPHRAFEVVEVAPGFRTSLAVLVLEAIARDDRWAAVANAPVEEGSVRGTTSITVWMRWIASAMTAPDRFVTELDDVMRLRGAFRGRPGSEPSLARVVAAGLDAAAKNAALSSRMPRLIRRLESVISGEDADGWTAAAALWMRIGQTTEAARCAARAVDVILLDETPDAVVRARHLVTVMGASAPALHGYVLARVSAKPAWQTLDHALRKKNFTPGLAFAAQRTSARQVTFWWQGRPDGIPRPDTSGPPVSDALVRHVAIPFVRAIDAPSLKGLLIRFETSGGGSKFAEVTTMPADGGEVVMGIMRTTRDLPGGASRWVRAVLVASDGAELARSPAVLVPGRLATPLASAQFETRSTLKPTTMGPGPLGAAAIVFSSTEERAYATAVMSPPARFAARVVVSAWQLGGGQRGTLTLDPESASKDLTGFRVAFGRVRAPMFHQVILDAHARPPSSVVYPQALPQLMSPFPDRLDALRIGVDLDRGTLLGALHVTFLAQ